MKFNRKILKKDYVKPIIVGFAAFYLVSMLLSTYLMKCEINGQYVSNIQKQMENVADSIYTISSQNGWDGKDLTADQIRYLKFALSYEPDHYDKYNPFSMALYDYEGNLVAQTTNLSNVQWALPVNTHIEEPLYLFYDLNEYLSEEEITELAKFRRENYDSYYVGEHVFIKEPFPYLTDVQINKDTYDLQQLTVYQAEYTEQETDSELITDYTLNDKTAVWAWTNPDVGTDKTYTIQTNAEGAYFPYLSQGMSVWKKWNSNEFLQKYPEKVKSGYYKNEHGYSELQLFMNDNLNQNGLYQITFGADTAEEYPYMLVLRCEMYSWLAAMDYMRFIYLWGFVMAVVCIIKILQATEKTYEKQRVLEETRRDFTNAIAHELKTPLGVIRGFAENLKENTMNNKRDYYLDQIIGQTDEMDRMVQEMIYVSKLDSEQLVLKKEPVGLFTLIQTQFTKLDALASEKNLNIQFENHADFILEGDRAYLEKALWNLASNAVCYNIPNGIISVICDENQLLIKNTGTPIPAEDMPHVFDMFFTGDKSRNTREKHLGLGLYLAKKIFSLHGLTISITNTDHQVLVIITR